MILIGNSKCIKRLTPGLKRQGHEGNFSRGPLLKQARYNSLGYWKTVLSHELLMTTPIVKKSKWSKHGKANSSHQNINETSAATKTIIILKIN